MKFIPYTPEGTRDRLFSECRERRQVQSQLTHLFSRRGYAGDRPPRRWSSTTLFVTGRLCHSAGVHAQGDRSLRQDLRHAA